MAHLHLGDQEARRLVADIDHDDAVRLQGEGYGVFPDDQERSSNSPPRRSSEAPIKVHHQRNDPFFSGNDAPVDAFSGLENLEAKQRVAERATPVPGYGDFEGKQGDASRSLQPTSGYGGHPDQVTKHKDEGYISLGIAEESQDGNNSENSSGGLSEEGSYNTKEREGTAPYESMAKELEDRPVRGEYIGVAPPKESSEDQEQRDGVRLQAALGINTEEPLEREGDPHDQAPAMAAELEGGSSAEASGGIVDVQSLKGDYVDLSEGSNTKEPKIDDSIELSRNEPSVDEPVEALHAEEGKAEREGAPHDQTPAMAEEHEGSVSVAGMSGGIVDVRSLKGDYVDLSEDSTNEPKVDDSSECSGNEPVKAPRAEEQVEREAVPHDQSTSAIAKEPEDGSAIEISGGIDDVQPLKGDAVDLSEDSTNEPKVDYSIYRDRNEPVKAACHAEEQVEREGVPRDETPAIAKELESSSAAGISGGIVDVQSLKGDYVDLSEGSKNEHAEASNVEEKQAEGQDGSHDQSTAITNELEDGSAAERSQGIVDVQSLKGDYVDLSKGSNTNEPHIDDSVECIRNEPAEPSHGEEEQVETGGVPCDQTHQARELEGGSAVGTSGGIIDEQSLKGDPVDLSEGSSYEPKADDSIEGNRNELADVNASDADASQIKFPIDDPEQDFSRGYSSQKQEDFSDDSELRPTTDYASREGPSINELKQQPQADGFSKNEDKQADAIGNAPMPLSSYDDSSKADDSKDCSAMAGDNQQEDFTEAATPISPPDDSKQEQVQACTNDDEAHGCVSFEGDDGKEKIKAEGYNIYSGEPENVIYDAEQVLGDSDAKPAYEAIIPDAAMKPHEDLSAKEGLSPEQVATRDTLKKVSGFTIEDNEQARDSDSKEQEELFAQHLAGSAVQQDAGLKLDPRNQAEDVNMRENAENVQVHEQSPYVDAFRIDSSEIERDGVVEVDSQDREDSSAVAQDAVLNANKEVDPHERENIQKSPYTESAETDDDRKSGYGADDLEQKHNEEVDRELPGPTEKVGQEEERRPTDEHPLEKAAEFDNYAAPQEENVIERAFSEHVRHGTGTAGTEEGAYHGAGAEGEGMAHEQHGVASISNEEIGNTEVPRKPPSLQYSQPDNPAGTPAVSNQTNSGDDGQQDHEGKPHKKGVFQKIKEKLTPPFTSH